MAPDPRSERAGVRGGSRPALEGLLLIRMLGGAASPSQVEFFFMYSYFNLDEKNKEFYRCACLVIEQILFVPEAIY